VHTIEPSASDDLSDDGHGRTHRQRRAAPRRHPGASAGVTRPCNREIAARLREAADLLLARHADPARVRAYRVAAEAVRRLDRELCDPAGGGVRAALEVVPGIERPVARAIAEMLRSGRWRLLERLRGHAEPERLLQMIPGVGPQLARRIYEALQVDTLDGLEAAMRDGRLDEVPGLGERRSAMLRKAVGDLLHARLPAMTADK
jgi:DNA polymerase/3'-5' exonuclease PolX